MVISARALAPSSIRPIASSVVLVAVIHEARSATSAGTGPVMPGMTTARASGGCAFNGSSMARARSAAASKAPRTTPARHASMTSGGTGTPDSHALTIPGFTGQPSAAVNTAENASLDSPPLASRTNSAGAAGWPPRE